MLAELDLQPGQRLSISVSVLQTLALLDEFCLVMEDW